MRKKQEKIIVPQTGTEMLEAEGIMTGEQTMTDDAKMVSQTDSEKERYLALEDSVQLAEVSGEEAVSQTGLEKEPEDAVGSTEVSGTEAISQTGLEEEAELVADCEEGVFFEPVSQMGPENEHCLDKAVGEAALSEAIPHTGSEKEADRKSTRLNSSH